MKRNIKLGAGIAFLGFPFFFSSCGEKAVDTTVTDLSAYFAQGLALSSPTAGRSATQFAAQSDRWNLLAAVDADATIEEKAAVFEALATATTVSACSFTLPNLGNLGQRANCYGPTVTYSTHPDGTPAEGSLPGGDLGLWTASESEEACAVAQLNRISAGAAAYSDASIMLQAASVCVLNNSSAELPAEGESLTYTDELSEALTLPAAATITSAVITRLGASRLLFEIEGTTDGTKAFQISINHTATADEKVYTGSVYGLFTAANKDAFSVEYSRATDALKVRMIAGTWGSNKENADIFNSSSQVNAGGSFQGNMNHAILAYNPTTKVGSISYAWQAGGGDSHTRVFNVYVGGSGTERSGCGFFGYGPKFSMTMAENLNEIDGMICNWAGPGNSHNMTSTSNLAQKQCFEESDGKFVLVAEKNNIHYWPTNSCDKGTIGLSVNPVGGISATAHDLVDLEDDEDFANYTAPTAP